MDSSWCWVHVKSCINSSGTGICGKNVNGVISKRMSRIKFMSSSREITRMWMSHYACVDESTLVQVMVWYRQATSHHHPTVSVGCNYLSLLSVPVSGTILLSFPLTLGLLNCFNILRPRQNGRHFPNDMFDFRWAFHWNLFLNSELTILAAQATSHWMNQWWSDLPTHICVTWLSELHQPNISKI